MYTRDQVVGRLGRSIAGAGSVPGGDPMLPVKGRPPKSRRARTPQVTSRRSGGRPASVAELLGTG